MMPFKDMSEKALLQSFETGCRAIRVSLFERLHSQHSAKMPEESSVLVAQVVNYLIGEDTNVVIQNADEPLKSKIARIRHFIPKYAAVAMAESISTRQVIVGTLRMREVLRFMFDGESYLRSDEHQRICTLLSTYGPEFPEEIKPDTYLAMALRYRQEQFGAE